MTSGAGMTYDAVLREFVARLERAGVYAPEEDARALLAHVLEGEDRGLDAALIQKAEALVRRREAREPLARILGYSVFWGLKFTLADKVFRPDPQVEALVEHALLLLRDKKGEALRILDLGTGSGCLLLTLLHESPGATGVGVDRDTRALDMARQNAKALGLAGRAVFHESDWGAGVDEAFDLVIANPPAVLERTLPLLDPEMRDYETPESLMGGADGLQAYREIARDLERLLKPDGVAVLRAHTWDREARVLDKAGFAHIEVKGNYRQNPICVIVRGEKRKSFFARLLGILN